MRINNRRVSDLAWDDDARVGLEQALAGAERATLEEAYCYVSQDGSQRVGPHHEVMDDVMVLNRDAVYGCAARMRASTDTAFSEGWPLPFEESRLARSDRVKALQHLGRHMRDMDKVPIYTGQ